MERSGLSRQEAEGRLAAQMPITEKPPLADLVIANEGQVEQTREQVRRVWQELLLQERQHRGDGVSPKGVASDGG